MRISGKDLVFLVGVCSLVVLIFLVSEEPGTVRVPYDGSHRAAYEVLQRTGSKRESEKVCEGCHNEKVLPLPAKHPAGNRCLLCHGMERTPR